MSEWQDDDELTDDDLKFLNRWTQMGQSDTADSEYTPEMGEPEHEGGIAENIEAIGEHKGESEAESDELDPESEGDIPSDQKSDEIDDSKMDLSNIEGRDELQDTSDHDEDESDTGDGGELGDYSDAEDDELDMEEDEPDPDMDFDKGGEETHYDQPDHLESGEGETTEGDDELEYDQLEDDPDSEQKVEDEFEGDERGNTESEIKDLDEYEKQREEAEREITPEEEDQMSEGRPEPEQELNAEGESDFEGDAQQELEDHLRNSEQSPDQSNQDDDQSKDAEDVQESGESENEPNDEQEDRPGGESPQEQTDDVPQGSEHDPQDTPSEQQEGAEGIFEGLPDPDQRCNNHCEDNPEDDEPEECEHCAERLARERELWGPIATDKHGNDILPGDKLRVAIPMPFTVSGAILTANVPNVSIEPNRVAESTAGEIDPDVCWLSGRQISRFTGWHMTEDGAIWTFQKGKKIRFVEKIGEPLHQRHGSNDLDGDQLDSEDMLEKLRKDMDEFGGENDDEPEAEGQEEPEEELEDSEEPVDEDDSEEEAEIDDSENSEDIEEHRKRRSNELTTTQKARFESLTQRIHRKIVETFGQTCEYELLTPVEDHSQFAEATVKVYSRGAVYTIKFTVERGEAPEQEAPEGEAA